LLHFIYLGHDSDMLDMLYTCCNCVLGLLHFIYLAHDSNMSCCYSMAFPYPFSYLRFSSSFFISHHRNITPVPVLPKFPLQPLIRHTTPSPLLNITPNQKSQPASTPRLHQDPNCLALIPHLHCHSSPPKHHPSLHSHSLCFTHHHLHLHVPPAKNNKTSMHNTLLLTTDTIHQPTHIQFLHLCYILYCTSHRSIGKSGGSNK